MTGDRTATTGTGPAEPEVASDTLMRELVRDVTRYFVRRLDTAEDAADAAAETLLQLWRRRSSVPAGSSEIRMYAFGIARNTLKSFRRGHGRRMALADRLRDEVCHHVSSSPPEIDVELRDALKVLRKTDRELVLLVAWEGFSVSEAAEVVGIRADAARQRYSRARAKLRRELDR